MNGTTAPVVAGPGSNAAATDAQLVTPNPFVRATTEHVEPLPLDFTAKPGAAARDVGQVAIPAFGYLRSIYLTVSATGGAAGGNNAVYKEDAPWSAIDSVSVVDTNGGQFVGPLTGYELYLINKWGGYTIGFDPVNSPNYTAPATSGNFAFDLRIPIELSIRDAVGAVPNMNSSATFKLNLTLAATSAIYSTAPDTLPDIRIRGWAEEWAPVQPNLGGLPNEMEPPATGTTQLWSRQVINIAAGQQAPLMTRMGNIVRNWITIARTTAPARSDSMYPDPMLMTWDGVQMLNEPKALRKRYMKERFSFAPDTGVMVWDYTHDFDNAAGGELRDLYIATEGSSRFEFPTGVWGSAGTLTVLTNDVMVPAGESIFVN